MGIFDFNDDRVHAMLAEKRASNVQGGHPRDPALVKLFRSSDSGTGVYVDDDVAFSIPTFYACVKVLSEDVGKLPLFLYKKATRGREKAVNYYLYDLINRRPNRWQTPFEFKQVLVRHKLTRGNAYAEIITDQKTGQISDLIPRDSARVTPFMAPDGKRAYAYQPSNGPRRVILQHEMLHLMGMSDDGITGRSVLEDARNTLGLAYSTIDYGSKFFANGAMPAVTLEHPGTIGPENIPAMVEAWEGRFKGTSNAHKVAILEEGMKLNAVSLTAEDAQLIESRKLSPIDICQFFRMPPHKVGILDKASFSNIEQQALEYVGDALLSHLVSFEQTCDRDLLKTENEIANYYHKFNPDILLRADIAARNTAYNTAVQGGWMSRNEVREKEDMNPFEGGDEYLQPLNMTPAGQKKPKGKDDGTPDIQP